MDEFILIINGSPHSDGYTAKMIDCLTNRLGEHYGIKICNAFAEHFAPCDDCGVCKKINKCSKSDMDEFYWDFEQCAAVVISTPIYNMSFPAPLKSILDRMQRYFNARFSLGIKPPIAKYRPAALIAVGGDDREDGQFMKKQLQRTFTVTNCTLKYCIVFSGTDSFPIQCFPSDTVRCQIIECADILEKCITENSQ